jgi:hypothetical protein
VKHNIFKNALWLLYITIAFIALDDFYAIHRFLEIGADVQGHLAFSEYLRRCVFIAEYVAAIAVLYICLRVKWVYALIFLSILWPLTLIDLSAFNILGRAATLADIANLNGAAGNILDAFAENSHKISTCFVLTSILFVPILLNIVLNRKSDVKKYYMFFLPVGMLAFMYFFILVVRGQPALVGFPKGFSYGFGTAALHINSLIANSKKAAPLTPNRVSDVRFRKIIVIIDESVNYDEFARFVSENDAIINYGGAYSGANCSASSNYIIRKASWLREDSRDTLEIKETESLFSLAKRSNYKTFYLDNQNVLSDPMTRNYFDDKEIRKIDEVVKPKGPPFERDMASLEAIKRIIMDDDVFIMVNKFGTHFPYANTLPLRFRTGDKMRDYLTSLKINAWGFIESLANIIDDETIVFYTSDHGQDLYGITTHCKTGDQINDSEYRVPFIVMLRNRPFKKILESNVERYRGKLTHLEFSESIRNAMGFRIDGFDSVFHQPSSRINHQFCGLYGPPFQVFGVRPQCHLVGLIKSSNKTAE